MPTPATIDLEKLLAPIAEGRPAGDSLEYEGTYDKIRAARETDSRSQFEPGGKGPDWSTVVRLASPALAGRTKDLQLAVWLTEALTHLHGFAGLRDGLHLLAGLMEGYWDTVHPAVEDGDAGYRVARLSFLNTKLPASVLAVPIVEPSTGSSYGWVDWKDSRDVDNLRAQSTERYEAALAEGRVTGDTFDAVAKAGSLAFYETLLADLVAARHECDRLAGISLEKLGKDAPGLSALQQALDDCHHVVERITREKRPPEPTADDEAEAGGTTADGSAAPAGGRLPLEPTNRADALRRLAAVAAFFRRTEPHSPVAYLVQRAIKWAEMPLETWLRDVIPSDDVLRTIREHLGIKEES